ncbi:NHL repeat-containing protein [Cyclobacterium amurskyense]|uniref:NHL repeat containing protein n=1 Tax=Cyclobacterium amurskyense TaxID=320787 RepID=A0A0H4P8H7_9BACT|nr:peptidylglycine monooxygenase [Cyclobacterium amurskyense]AKP50781.1 NHL repeat containing protein [Cyclobacterium amurskyense]|tara:strand:- start:208 stop:1275 length:1068 start_codon:yes stop_codon:yes gene_type:complete
MKENLNPRREFLKKSGLTVLAGAVVPNIIVNKTYAMEKDNLLGHGSHRYKVIEGWGNLDPVKNPVNDCHEMVEDAKGRLILLTNETKNNVIIYDKSGKLLETWGSTYPGAHGLTISDEGGEEFLYISDNTRSQVIKTDLKGREIMVIDYPRETGNYAYPKQFVPTETAINPANGDIYIVDGYGLNYVTQYNAKGELIRQFGGKGETNETFNCCHGILVDTRDKSNPTLLITDRGNMQYKRFTLDGKYIKTIPTPGSFVCRPVLRGDNVYAAVYRSTTQAYPNSGYITILDKNDQVVSTPGGTAPEYVNGELQEQRKDMSFQGFMHPHDVCVDRDENIYVPQWASQKTYPVKLERV